jgi:serine phosphatase RsbU (regulator of sigma subunit)
MTLRESITGTVMTKARRERAAYWRSVPVQRLWLLAVAAFFLFAVNGLMTTMLTVSASRLVNGLTSAIYAGIVAVFYLLVIARKPIMIPLLVTIQVLTSIGLARFQLWAIHRYPPVEYQHAIHVYAGAALALTAMAYACFFAFIQTEGRDAIRAQAELTLAHGIQQTLVPVVDEVLGGCEIYGISVPSEKVGGDLVDVVALTGGSAIAYVADIAGHGLQAGILMGMVKTAARTRLLDKPTPPALFETLNQVLPGVKEAHMYATCAALRLEKDGEQGCLVEYALAGHPAILYLPAGTSSGEPLADQQFPLGIMPVPGYRSQTIRLRRGDMLIVASDGLLEICNKDGDEFGSEGLLRAVVNSQSLKLPEMAQQIFVAAKAFGKQEDDQTLLVIRVT